jgi:hypothetical protein
MSTSVEKQRVIQGDSSRTFRIRFDGIDVSLCTCRQAVKASVGENPVIDSPVTGTVAVDSVDHFLVSLTPNQTSLLDVGNWMWGVQLEATGTFPPQTREIHIDLEILAQVVE